MYKEAFMNSDLTYTDIAHELGCCELTARKKINGQTKVTKAEQQVLDKLLMEETDTCMISRRNR